MEYWKSLQSPPFGGDFCFSIAQRKLGTYGLLKNARHFLYGAAAPSPTYYLSYGYLLEHIVLRATELGLATCWVGGYRTGGTPLDLDLPKGFQTGAVVAVGHPAAKPAVVELAIHGLIKPHRRKPASELFFYRDFSTPVPGTAPRAIKDALEMVRLAPSAANMQPWRLLVDENLSTVHFYRQKTAASLFYERNHLQIIDMGIATCHLELSLKDAGVEGRWSIENAPLHAPLHAPFEYIATWRAL